MSVNDFFSNADLNEVGVFMVSNGTAWIHVFGARFFFSISNGLEIEHTI